MSEAVVRASLRYLALAACVFGLSACKFDWQRAERLDGGDPTQQEGQESAPPPPPTTGTGGDPVVAGGDEDADVISDNGGDSAISEAGLDAAPATETDASVGAPPSDAGTSEASTSDTDVDADAAADAGCAPCGENAVCDLGSRTCRCAPDFFDDGQRCKRDPCANITCEKSRVCQVQTNGEGACVCTPSTFPCGDKCVDTRQDRENCGYCGLACAGSLQCLEGVCEQSAQQLVLSRGQTCVVQSGGSAGPLLKCVGDNSWGFYRDTTPEGYSLRLRDVRGVDEASLVTLSDHHRCVVPPGSGVVRCWGSCMWECGTETFTSYEEFTDIPAENVVGLASVSLIAGRAATCIHYADATARCVGWNPFVLDTTTHVQPRLISIQGEPLLFRDLEGGYEHFCGAIGVRPGEEHRAVCWGRNTWNQLGSPLAPTPDQEPTGEPPIYYVRKESGDELTGVLTTSTGGLMSCAVLGIGEVYCWGNNDLGMLGHGDEAPHGGAVMVRGLEDTGADDVAVGNGHACVLLRDRTVRCWGYGFSAGQGDRQGDMGNGSYFSTPQVVPGLQGVVELRANNGHSCARLNTGAVVCWGDNGSGQLGDGTAIARPVPTPMHGLP
ncbi:MAG TPA: hypothetical protein VFZ61_19735 [Polyangiales bacterium]